MLFKYFLAWFPMLLLAILNGVTRDLAYLPYMDELSAHQISTFILIILLAIYIRFIIKKHPPKSSVQAFLLGIFWMSLTLAFEFGFGYYRGNSLQKSLADYNLLQGHLWVFIPIWLCFSPYFFYKRFKTRF